MRFASGSTLASMRLFVCAGSSREMLRPSLCQSECDSFALEWLGGSVVRCAGVDSLAIGERWLGGVRGLGTWVLMESLRVSRGWMVRARRLLRLMKRMNPTNE
jgi:hypothetical protein